MGKWILSVGVSLFYLGTPLWSVPVAPPPAEPPVFAEDVLQQRDAAKLELKIASMTDEPLPMPVDVAYWKEAADDLDDVTLTVSPGYSVVTSGSQIEGSGAFHLVHSAGITTETILLNPAFEVAADTQLFFESRLGGATAAQVARVEISTDAGASWQPLWSLAGSGFPGQTSFERVTIPLQDFAGNSVRIRFQYAFSGGSYYPGTGLNLGWLIDDIQIGSSYIIEAALHSIGDPTGLEQQNLEFINRARASASAEAVRLRDTTAADVIGAMQFFNVDKALLIEQFATLAETVQPLAFNAKLLATARLHSRDMFENAFQGHVSSANPIPPNLAGDTLTARLNRQGYAYQTAGENVYSYAKNTWHAHAGFNIDWGSGSGGSIGGMQNPPGHRLSIHNGNYREIGIGIVEGSNGPVGPMLLTQNFGTSSDGNQPLITGVAWDDLNSNGFYDPGEGLSGIEVSLDGERFKAVTSTSGGYAVPVFRNGDFLVTFSSDNTPTFQKTVTVVDMLNVKLDYPQHELPPMITFSIQQFGTSPQDPAMRRLRLSSSASSLMLEYSPDLNSWQDLPLVVPVHHGDGEYSLDFPALQSPAFYRVRLLEE